MNARAEMPKPNWQVTLTLLDDIASGRLMEGVYKRFASEQRDLLRAWLAAQPLAPEDGDDVWAKVDANGGDERCVPNNAATPPAPAREPVAWRVCWVFLDYDKNEHIQKCEVFDKFPASRPGIDGCISVTPLYPAAGAVVVDEALLDRFMAAAVLPISYRDSARIGLTAAIGGGK